MAAKFDCDDHTISVILASNVDVDHVVFHDKFGTVTMSRSTNPDDIK